jgi:hypothetical protein
MCPLLFLSLADAPERKKEREALGVITAAAAERGARRRRRLYPFP